MHPLWGELGSQATQRRQLDKRGRGTGDRCTDGGGGEPLVSSPTASTASLDGASESGQLAYRITASLDEAADVVIERVEPLSGVGLGRPVEHIVPPIPGSSLRSSSPER